VIQDERLEENVDLIADSTRDVEVRSLVQRGGTIILGGL
jgi:hypothetical protein